MRVLEKQEDVIDPPGDAIGDQLSLER